MKLVGWFLKVVGVILAMVLVLGLGIYARGRSMISHVYERPLPSLAAATDTTSIARGEHLARVACTGCHSEGASLPLTGSVENFIGTAEGRGMGILYAPNLTPGGHLAHLSDGQVARAVREGIGHDGHGLLIMPAGTFHAMSDSDLVALLSYLRAQPAVDSIKPERQLHALAAMILGAGVFPLSVQPPVAAPAVAPAVDSTAVYGAYLAPLLSCRECHGPDYRGRKSEANGPPGGPNILAVAHHHPLESFRLALRSGIAPTDGRPLNPSFMPWPAYSSLTDTEIAAVYHYLASLPETQPARR
jgi:mono/diheme cytochrome c family protein